MTLKDIKTLKMTRAEYETQQVETCRIENWHEWHEWMQKYWSKGVVSRAMFNRGCRITQNNTERLRKWFGKCAFTYPGEFFLRAWALDLGTARVLVFTGKGKGTSYEVILQWDGKKVRKDIGRVLEFMDMMAEPA